jgi:hypothetical protein
MVRLKKCPDTKRRKRIVAKDDKNQLSVAVGEQHVELTAG